MADIRSFQGISPVFAARVYLDRSAVIVGDIHIGEDSSVWPLVAMRGDVNHIRIGARTNIQDGSVLHVTHRNPDQPDGYPLIIGDDVTIGHKVVLHGCHIADRVLVGMGAIVMDGAHVASDVMIGAGSLVPPGMQLEAGHLYMGQPARLKRPLTTAELAWLRRSAANYVQYAREHAASAQLPGAPS